MRYIGIIILLVLCLTVLLFTGCKANTVKPEPAGSSTGSIEEPVIEEDTEATGTIYPQQWATGTGTASNPWANDCIKKALDFAPAGGTVYLKAGYYILSTAVHVTKQVNIIGEGRNKTIIITADAFGFNINTVNYVTLKGFTIDGDAQTDGVGYYAPINIAHSDYISLEDIETKNSGYYGIGFYECNHSSFQNIYAHDNYRHGVSSASDTAGRNMYNTYRDIYAWNNGFCGFDDRGSSADLELQRNNLYDNIQCWNNEHFGIAIASQSGSVLSNSFANGNGESGIWMHNIEDFNVHDCFITLSGKEGLAIGLSKNVNFTNVIAKNNNVSDTFYTAGVYIDSSSGIKFMSCQSYDDRDTPLQAYGIELAGANTNISLVNCKLTPNKEEEIYNPAGAVLTVIAEKKRLSKF